MAATDATVASSPVAGVESARDLATKMLEAWNSHDADALHALSTEDIAYDDSSWPKQMHGHAEVDEFLESTWRAVPDLKFEFEDVLVSADGSQIAHYWHGTATQTGAWDPPGLAPTGRPLKFEGVFLGEIRDGKLSRVRVVHDVAKIMRQAGILPEPGSRGEHLIVTLANLRAHLRRH